MLHQLRVRLVGVDRLAEVDEIVVGVEAAEVNPQTAERAVVVLAVSTDINRRLADALALLVGDSLFEILDRVVQFWESNFDFWSVVEFSEF